MFYITIKKHYPLLLLLIIFLAAVFSVKAAALAPRYRGNATISATIRSSDYYATANGTDNISRISVSATLYEKGFLGTYHQVSSCSNTSNSTLCTASASYSLKSGKNYRLDYSATFYYSDGTNETISNSQYKNT